MTDIQALREELSNPAIGSNAHLRKIALALLDELEAAERLITEWEQRELSNKRQLVINGLCESGAPFWEIEDYMKKWDAVHPREAAATGIGVKGE
ncbi:hypothetical protein QU896_03480 [Citrobacter freundii]|uniref:hypothetical protein n=1 Tax=Citrobacter freundii TaxID=546 RepID=UPI000D9E7E21|nr:hypothetical protein [Citrobacter portucalensis]SQD10770.1 Uncharacterised protein [Citrobacter freundii]DAW18634.1 MAG TPA: hypothetical protein [Caudoviricetes sp.]